MLIYYNPIIYNSFIARIKLDVKTVDLLFRTDFLLLKIEV
jgi:hypothetical protein